MIEYLNFEIEIKSAQKNNYPVSVRSPAGETQTMISFPDRKTLAKKLRILQRTLKKARQIQPKKMASEEKIVRSFGHMLFNMLVVDEVLQLYIISRQMSEHQEDKRLRIKLTIHPPELAVLPWELLYDSRFDEFLTLSYAFPIVRYLNLPQSIRPLTVSLPLRILGITVAPEADKKKLDIAHEKRAIKAAVKPLFDRGLVELQWLEGETRQDLQNALQQEEWHILHFIGHGGFDSEHEEGTLILADDEGEPDHFRADQFARLLTDHRSLRVVLLNACAGTKRNHMGDIFFQTAETLVQGGIPAVVVTQDVITDLSAAELTEAFYEALADGLPVDAVLTEARKAITFAFEHTLEWITPVLFMRSPDGKLFEIQEDFGSLDYLGVSKEKMTPNQRLISKYQRRLRALKDQKMALGHRVDPYLSKEIEHLEAEIDWLQTQGEVAKNMTSEEAKDLRERLDMLYEDYQAINSQLSYTLNTTERTRQRRQLRIIEREIQELEAELVQLLQ